MRACSVSEQDSHIPLDRRTFLRWLSRLRGRHESGSPSFSIRRANRRVHREEITQNDLWELAADSDFGKETAFVCWLFGPSPKRSCNAGLCRCHEGICRLKRLQMFNALSKFNTYP